MFLWQGENDGKGVGNQLCKASVLLIADVYTWLYSKQVPSLMLKRPCWAEVIGVLGLN